MPSLYGVQGFWIAFDVIEINNSNRPGECMSKGRELLRLPVVIAMLLQIGGTAVLAQENPVPEPYYDWKVEESAINAPLGGLVGNPKNGRKIVVARKKGNCIACHIMPIPEEDFHGTLGPPLVGLSSRYTEGQIRLRIIDTKQVNPMSVMPGYYRDPKNFNQVRKSFKGKTVLTAQEIEDVVTYLMTLK